MNISTHSPCNADSLVALRHILPFSAGKNRMPVRREPASVFVGRRKVADNRMGMAQQMEEALLTGDRTVEALRADQPSSHDFRLRHAREAAEEYHWAEEEPLGSHDAAGSLQGDNREARGGDSQDGKEFVELRQGTW